MEVITNLQMTNIENKSCGSGGGGSYDECEECEKSKQIINSLKIESLADLKHFLHKFQYLGCSTLPIKVYTFVYDNKEMLREYLSELEHFEPDTLGLIPMILKYHQNSHDNLMNMVALDGDSNYSNINFMKFLHSKGYEWDRTTTNILAEKGHFKCLKEIVSCGCEWTGDVLEKAAENGHLNILKYAHENGCPKPENDNCGTITFLAAGNGHLACLDFAVRNGYYVSNLACINACINDKFDC